MIDRMITWAVEEHGGDRYPDLVAAQSLALTPLAIDLAATMRALVAQGVLRREKGIVVVNQEKGSAA